jgi:hypothetical protein
MGTPAANQFAYFGARNGRHRRPTEEPLPLPPLIGAALRHAAHEAVSHARNGFDVAPAAFAQGFSQARDVHGENALFDERLRPDQIEEFALGQQPPRVADQSKQDFVSLWLQGDGLASLQETPFGYIQCELCEFVNFSHVG